LLYTTLIMSRNIAEDGRKHSHTWTSQRRLLLEILINADGHLDAKELYRLASMRDESISPATVYRSLNLFKELGIIEKRILGKIRCYYEIKRSVEHQHFCCQGCGKIIEFRSDLLRDIMHSIEKENDFKITKADLYLEGFCPQCEDKANE